MSSNVRPLALTASESRLIHHGAESCFKAALAEITRGIPDEATATRPDARALRQEMALAMYRVAMRELGEVAPASESCVCLCHSRICDTCFELRSCNVGAGR